MKKTIAALVITLVVLTSCLSSGQLKSGGAAAGSCAFSDFIKYVADVKTALGKESWTTAIEQTAKDDNLTEDALTCVVEGVVAGEATPSSSPSTGQESPTLVHARAYLAAHPKK